MVMKIFNKLSKLLKEQLKEIIRSLRYRQSLSKNKTNLFKEMKE